jgi:uncharacterized membrane protein
MPLARWRAWLASQWEALRASYWFVPTWMALLSAAAALGALELDRRVPRLSRLPWVFDAGAEGSREVLGVVAGSMITVTGVVFSITIVALTLASSQFGPRLLRSFMRDRGNQMVLGTFVATFLFNLLVLRAVRDNEGTRFVPHLSESVAFALGVTSLFVLIYFIHHAARSIQASHVIQSVAEEVDAALPRLYPESLGTGADEPRFDAEAVAERLRKGWSVRARRSGYIRLVDAEGLFELACRNDLVVGIERRPGAFVCEGAVLARAAGSETSWSDELEGSLRDVFALGTERTAVQDLAFLTDQLAELAVRALSPGTNDPHTAVACVHRLGVVLAALAAREFPSPARFDEDGNLRVLAPCAGFEELAWGMLGPVRRYGAGDADVATALLEAVGEALDQAREGPRREVLLRLGEEIRATSVAALGAGSDRARVERAWSRWSGAA